MRGRDERMGSGWILSGGGRRTIDCSQMRWYHIIGKFKWLSADGCGGMPCLPELWVIWGKSLLVQATDSNVFLKLFDLACSLFNLNTRNEELAIHLSSRHDTPALLPSSIASELSYGMIEHRASALSISSFCFLLFVQ